MPSRYGRPSEGCVGPGWEMGSSRQPVSIAEVGAVRDTGLGSGSQRRRLLCAGWVPSAHPLHLRWTVPDGFTTVEVSWNSVPWGRMVNKFFLQEINAHGCMRRNLGRGSVATMRMLKQLAGG